VDKLKKHWVWFFIISGLLIPGLQAEGIHVSAFVDTNQIRIGEQVQMHLNIRNTANRKILFPADSLIWNPFILISKQSDTSLFGDTVLVKHSFQLTTFDTGSLHIPSLHLGILNPNGDTDSIITQSFQIMVATVPVDTTAAIKPIHDPMKAGLTLGEILIRIAIPVIVLLLLLLIWYLWKKQKSKKQEEPGIIPPDIDPWEWALHELDLLEDKKLWQNAKVKAYYSRLTDILRIYFTKVFHEPVLESTSKETLQLMSRYLAADLLEAFEHILHIADGVKFAKAQPFPDENGHCMSSAKDLIKESIPEPKEPES